MAVIDSAATVVVGGGGGDPADPVPAVIRHSQDSTSAFVNDRLVGVGTLVIAEDKVSWVKTADHRSDDPVELVLRYRRVAVHAIKKDECLYLMVDGIEGVDGMCGEEEEEAVTEVKFAPEDKTKLEAMYRAMSHCQELHPDPLPERLEEEEEEEGEGEEEEEEGMFDDAEETNGGGEGGGGAMDQ